MDAHVSRLDNGLTVVSATLPGFHSATVAVFAKVGSRYEPAGQNGISHVLEHMLFKGTKTRSAHQIALEIERVGASINAFTGFDRTCFHVTALAEHTPLALDILADVLLNSTFPVPELKTERKVILQEIKACRDDPQDLVVERFMGAAYIDQPLGRPVLGTRQTVASLKREALFAYMAQHYTANNLIVIAVGKVEHDLFHEMTEARFGHLAAGIPRESEPAHYGGGFAWQPNRQIEQTQVVLGFPVCANTDARYPATDLLSDVLCGGMSSPLFQEVREKRGLVYDIMAHSRHYRDTGTFRICAGTSEEHLPTFFKVTIDQLLRLCHTISDDDFERAKNQHRSDMLLRREEPFSLAREMAGDLISKGRVVPIEETLAAYEAVTIADIQAVAREMLQGIPTLSIVGKAKVPGRLYCELVERLDSITTPAVLARAAASH